MKGKLLFWGCISLAALAWRKSKLLAALCLLPIFAASAFEQSLSGASWQQTLGKLYDSAFDFSFLNPAPPLEPYQDYDERH